MTMTEIPLQSIGAHRRATQHSSHQQARHKRRSQKPARLKKKKTIASSLREQGWHSCLKPEAVELYKNDVLHKRRMEIWEHKKLPDITFRGFLVWIGILITMALVVAHYSENPVRVAILGALVAAAVFIQRLNARIFRHKENSQIRDLIFNPPPNSCPSQTPQWRTTRITLKDLKDGEAVTHGMPKHVLAVVTRTLQDVTQSEALIHHFDKDPIAQLLRFKTTPDGKRHVIESLHVAIWDEYTYFPQVNAALQ